MSRPLNTRNEQHIEHIYGGGTTKVGDKKNTYISHIMGITSKYIYALQ